MPKAEETRPMKFVCTFCDFVSVSIDDFFFHFDTEHKKVEPDKDETTAPVQPLDNDQEVSKKFFYLFGFGQTKQIT